MSLNDDLFACSIANWYPKFAKHTFPTVLIPLPDACIQWLLEDGVFVPPSSSAFPTRNKQAPFAAPQDEYRDWSDHSDEDGDEEEDGNKKQHVINPVEAFPELTDAINQAISTLDTPTVVPKLTWSVPKDATWMAVGQTLRCSTPEQVYLLLKSSDRIAHDLSSSTLDPSPNGLHHVLALRKWYDLRPGREFRCFVFNNVLVAISQRDISRRYDELLDEESSILTRIQAFYAGTIVNAASFPLSNYTFDCYVPTAANAGIKLIDFNPIGGTTTALLFEWAEFESLLDCNSKSVSASAVEKGRVEGAGVAFRIIKDDVALRPDTALYGVPFDFIDMSEGSALSALMEQAQRGNAVGGGKLDA